MSDDLIRRSDAIDAIMETCCYCSETKVLTEIRNLPTIEPKRGEWICHEGKWIDFDYYPAKYECNQCHHYVDVASDKNFCPNCGCAMTKESE